MQLLPVSRTDSFLATIATAQYGPDGQYGPDSSGSNGYGYSYGSDGDSNNPFLQGGFAGFGPPGGFSMEVTAHAILATLAFGLFFPIGGIMIRLTSFPGLWWMHGLFQIVAFIFYIAAFTFGVWMATNMRMLHNAHPIIGIIVFVILAFQPILGFLHHNMFKKHSRRVVWSYGHIWLGRIVITLGIINGGLGLRLSRKLGAFAARDSAVIAYGVLAGLMWLIYVVSAFYGEIERRRCNSAHGNTMLPPEYREVEPYKAERIA